MPLATALLGIALVVGVGGYVGAGSTYVPALIPAGFGALFVLLGAAGRDRELRPYALGTTFVIALMAVAGMLPSLRGLLANDLHADHPVGTVVQGVTAGLCAVFAAGALAAGAVALSRRVRARA